ncbi:hypothetical protein EIP91_010650 [Steccherinum ochraceum]|uniref:Fe2OG dioxygenase domain-containing protein n=1 Tax=Steccherinum ochraceum TaxID=92696 RepID=A0A4R0RQJ5_9APHY|nr:hypothetical protein EIP91_010650 [Steccherinum ochraceum]
MQAGHPELAETLDIETSLSSPEFTNVRSHLEDCLDNWNFDSAYSFSRSFKEAPNPALHLEGVGTVGLPLSERDACAIKRVAKLAPFGMGERTVVDKSVRDTWEMDASLVKVRNSDWQEFLSRVIEDVCKALGVDVATSCPRCDLYKLLLYETGSHFLPHVDTEKADGMFATLIVVLPSEFIGGEAHLSHDGKNTTYDSGAGSLCHTTVMAWYTDVMHEIKPITSGYRLALAYNLVHTTTSLRPALMSSGDALKKLRCILHAWTEDGGASAPSKIVYLLQHKYSQANLRASALKGLDANQAAVLADLAKEQGFHLGLASVVCRVEGDGDDHFGHQDYDEVDFCGDESRSTVIEQFVDLNGELISRSLDFEEEDETIPAELSYMILEGEHDRQEYEGYMGNSAGSLSRWYHRTVLVIWPNYSNISIQYGTDNIQRACSVLFGAAPGTPTSDDLALADFILTRAAKSPMEAARCVCRAARAWNNSSLWVRAVQTCCPLSGKGLDLFPDTQSILDAIAAFGFSGIREGLDILLRNDPRNAQRFAFVDSLEEWLAVHRTTDSLDMISLWIMTMRATLLDTLRPPTPEDVPFFVSLALKHGSVSFLRDSLLPSIKDIAGPEVLRDLAVVAYDEQRFQDPAEVKSQVTSEIMTVAISLTALNEATQPPPAVSYSSRRYSKMPLSCADPNPNLERAKSTLQACIPRFPFLIDAVFDRVADMTSMSVANAEKQVKEVLLPILQLMIDEAPNVAGGVPRAGIEKLLRVVMEAFLKADTKEIKAFKAEDVQLIVRAATLPGGPELLTSLFLPGMQKLAFTPGIVCSILEELDGLRMQVGGGPTGPSLQGAIASLSMKYANTVALYTTPAIADALSNCMKIQALEACTVIIKRIFEAKFLSAKYITHVLVPLIPELRRLCLQYNMLDGFAPAFQTILLAWIDKVLGTRPIGDGSAELSLLPSWTVTCQCADCSLTRAFLRSPEQTLKLERMTIARRTHLVAALKKYTQFACSWNAISSPPGLQVTKLDVIWKPIQWNTLQKQGEAILRTVSSDENELRRLLGPHYVSIVPLLRGMTGGPPPTRSFSVVYAAGVRRPLPSDTAEPASAGQAEPPAKRHKKTVHDARDVIDLT